MMVIASARELGVVILIPERTLSSYQHNPVNHGEVRTQLRIDLEESNPHTG